MIFMERSKFPDSFRSNYSIMISSKVSNSYRENQFYLTSLQDFSSIADQYSAIYHDLLNDMKRFETPEDVYLEMEKFYAEDNSALFMNFLGARQYYMKLVILALVKAPYFEQYAQELIDHYEKDHHTKDQLASTIQDLKDIWNRAETKLRPDQYSDFVPFFSQR